MQSRPRRVPSHPLRVRRRWIRARAVREASATPSAARSERFAVHLEPSAARTMPCNSPAKPSATRLRPSPSALRAAALAARPRPLAEEAQPRSTRTSPSGSWRGRLGAPAADVVAAALRHRLKIQQRPGLMRGMTFGSWVTAREDHDDLHARAQSRGPRHPEPLMRHPARVDETCGAGVPSVKTQIPRAYRHAAISHRISPPVGKAESHGMFRWDVGRWTPLLRK